MRNPITKSFFRVVLQVVGYTVGVLATTAQAGENPTPAPRQECNLLPAAESTSFWGTVYGLQDLYQRRAFNELDQSLSCLVSADKLFSTGQSGSSAAYWFFRIQMPGPGVERDESQRVEAWKINSPTSIFSEFAALRLSYADAWRFRGSAYAKHVSSEQFSEFTAKLSETVASLERASPALRQTTLWDNLMLAAVQDGFSDRERTRVVFEAAVAKWPRHFDFYEVALSRLVPRWGGSWDEVEATVGEWSKRIESTEGESMYARLYVGVLTAHGTNPHETSIDRKRMIESLDELLSRYPAPKFAAFAASLACFSEDKKAFEIAMQKLDVAANEPAYWIRGTDLNYCTEKLMRGTVPDPSIEPIFGSRVRPLAAAADVQS